MPADPISAERMSISSETIEDCFSVAAPLITERPAGRFSVVERKVPDHNGGMRQVTEIVTLTNDEQSVLYLQWDGNSDSAWSHDTHKLPGGPTAEILAFYAPPVETEEPLPDRLYVACIQGSGRGALFLTRDQDGTWSDASDVPVPPVDVQANIYFLDHYRTPDDAHYLLYTASLSGTALPFLSINYLHRTDGISPDEDPVQWSTADISSDVTSRYKIVSGSAADGFLIFKFAAEAIYYRRTAPLQSGPLADGLIHWADEAGDWTEVAMSIQPASLGDVVTIDSANDRVDMFQLSRDHELYYFTNMIGEFPSITRLTGGQGQPGAAVQFELGRDSDGNYKVFALDERGQRLWLLRQQGFDDNGHARFGEWVQLGGAFQAIAAPASMSDSAEIIGCTFQPSIVSKRQDTVSQVWRDTEIQIPIARSQDALDVTTHTTTIVLNDADGAPVSGSLVDIYAACAAEVYVNGLTHHVDRMIPATIATDPAGRITVSMRATKLVAPALLLHARDFMREGEGLALNAGRQSLDRLAGNNPAFTVDGAALRARGLVAATFSDDQAGQLAAAVRTVAAVTLKQNSEHPERLAQWFGPGEDLTSYWYVDDIRGPYDQMLDLSDAETSHLALDFTDPAGLRMVSLHGQAAVLAAGSSPRTRTRARSSATLPTS